MFVTEFVKTPEISEKT